MEVTATGLMPFGPTLLPTPVNPITAIPLAEGLMTNGDSFVEQLDSFSSSSPRINFLDELMVGSAVSLLAPHRRLIKDALIRLHVTDASVVTLAGGLLLFSFNRLSSAFIGWFGLRR